MTLLASFAALLPRILLGFFIVHSVWDAKDGKALLVKVFLSAGVGFGISSLLGFLWIWVGLPLMIYAILESVIAIALMAWMVYANRIILPSQKWIEKPDLIWLWILAAGIILFALNLAFYAMQFPHGRPDAWINWNVVARFIYLGGADWQATFLRQWDHPDYPLFMPMTHAITWVFIQEPSTWVPITYHFLLSLFVAGLLFSFVNLFRDLRQASLSTVLFISLPFIVDQSMRQYSDFLFGYLMLAGGGLVLLYFLKKDARLAMLVGLIVGLGGWAKNEGLMLIVGFSIVWVWIASKKEERLALRNYLLGLALPLLVIVLFKIFLAPSNDLFAAQGNLLDKALDVERYKIIFREAGTILWNLGGTPGSLIGLIILTIFLMGKSARSMPGMWIFGVLIGFQLLVYFVIFIFTPNDLIWHIHTSVDRLYLHVLPLAFLWLFIWLRSPQELISKES